jgi:hypothetical protein
LRSSFPARGEVLVHPFHQREIFTQRDRDAGGFQFLKKVDEHRRVLFFPAFRFAFAKLVSALHGCEWFFIDPFYNITALNRNR